MGLLFSRFRAKPSTKELLEDIEKEIEALEEYKRSTELQQKAVIRSLVFYSMILYMIVAAVFFFYSFPVATKDRLLCCIPFVVFPILLYVLKKFLTWYFHQKIRSNDETLIELKKKKKSLLEFAMETETYKVVKELLEKYDPEYHRKIFEPKPAIQATPSVPSSVKGSFADIELRRRNVSPKGAAIPLGASAPSISPGQTITVNSAAGSSHFYTMFPGKHPTNIPYSPPFYPRGGQPFVRSPMPPMPRPVLPRERTLIDRLVDYLVGDGPSNRYALICRQCQSHNGMALKEEFEFVAFRCCYCFTWNPPRSQHPPPPRLTLPAPPANGANSSTPAISAVPASVPDTSSSSDDTEIERLSDSESIISEPKKSVDSTDTEHQESDIQDKISISSENEIQANLVEDKPYDPQQNETFLHEFPKSEDSS